MNSKRLLKHAQDLHCVNQTGVPTLRGERSHGPIPDQDPISYWQPLLAKESQHKTNSIVFCKWIFLYVWLCVHLFLRIFSLFFFISLIYTWVCLLFFLFFNLTVEKEKKNSNWMEKWERSGVPGRGSYDEKTR